MWFIMYHYNKTQFLCITGVTQRKWIFLCVAPVIVKRMIADSENVLYNNPVSMKYTWKKEGMAGTWKG